MQFYASITLQGNVLSPTSRGLNACAHADRSRSKVSSIASFKSRAPPTGGFNGLRRWWANSLVASMRFTVCPKSCRSYCRSRPIAKPSGSLCRRLGCSRAAPAIRCIPDYLPARRTFFLPIFEADYQKSGRSAFAIDLRFLLGHLHRILTAS